MRTRPKERNLKRRTATIVTYFHTARAQRLRESRYRESCAAIRTSIRAQNACSIVAESAEAEDARLRLLDSLLDSLLSIDLDRPSSCNPTIGMTLERKVAKQPDQRKIKVDTCMMFLNHQLARITKDADQLILPRDNTRKILKCWNEGPPLSKHKLGKYKAPMRKNIQMMVAASVVALAGADFAGHLRSSAPLNWTMPQRLDGIDLNRIPNVRQETAERIVQSCIDELMKLVRSIS